MLQKAALVAWAALIILAVIKRDSLSVETIISYTPADKWAAALTLLGFFALKTLSVVFYSGLLFTVSGMLFDLPFAIAVSIAGTLVMLLEGYAIGRAGGQDLIKELSEKYPRFAAFTGLQGRRPFTFTLLIRMLKVVNYDIGSMYMGASRMRLIPYLAGSLTALLPEIILFAIAGNGISNMDALPAAASVAVYLVMTVLSIIILRYLAKNAEVS